jgi:hypothetical protein
MMQLMNLLTSLLFEAGIRLEDVLARGEFFITP